MTGPAFMPGIPAEPYLAACVDQARIDGRDQLTALQQAFHNAIGNEPIDAKDAGKTLVAYLNADNTIAELHKMPTWDALTLTTEQPHRTLIVATWPGGAA